MPSATAAPADDWASSAGQTEIGVQDGAQAKPLRRDRGEQRQRVEQLRRVCRHRCAAPASITATQQQRLVASVLMKPHPPATTACVMVLVGIYRSGSTALGGDIYNMVLQI